MHIRNLDFNLLVVLDALLREGSASGAGRLLGMSQSGVSHALGRLRELIGDQLFVRKAGRLVPTPRAEALEPVVREALAVLLEAVGNETVFDPATAGREFRMVMPDNAELAVLPPLLARCEHEAPGLTFQVRPGFARGHTADLIAGRLHLGLDLEVPRDGALSHAPWTVDDLVLIGRAGHPAIGASMTMAEFRELRHVLYHPPELSEPPLETMIRQRGVRRHLVARTASIAALVAAAAMTEAVAIVPRRVAAALSAVGDFVIGTLPFETHPLRTFLWWSSRLEQDPGHRWLREQVLDLATADLSGLVHGRKG